MAKGSKKAKRSTKSKLARPTDQAARPERPSGRWNQWIDPGEAAFLAQLVPQSIFIIKNLGPGRVEFAAQNGDDMTLPAGAVRATYARGAVTVMNKSEKPVMIEFEFLPIHLR